LAHTLENSGRADAAELAAHFAAAGEHDRASTHYVAAAAQAAEALAFDYAAALYELAFALRPPGGPEAPELRTRLAEALANSRRGAEAAEQYLIAAKGADAEQALELNRRAATQLLVSGHIDRGIEVLRDVMSSLGMKLAKGPKRALGAIILRRLLLSIRGLSFAQRAAADVPQKDLARIDTCWSASVGLLVVEPIYSADFQTRGLLLALRAGEPERIARFLALHAIQVAATGAAAEDQAKRIARRAKAIAREIGSAHATALVAAAEGIAAQLAGRWKQAVESLGEAERILRDHCSGAWWEFIIVEGFALSSLCYSGHVAELTRRLPAVLAEVLSRGDLLGLSRVGTLFLHWLAADDANDAQRQVDRCMSGWPRDKYPVQNCNRVHAEIEIQMYRGNGAAAWKIGMHELPTFERSLIFGVQLFRGLMYDMRARCALAAAMEMPDTASPLHAADCDARRLEREGTPWTAPLAQRIRAGIAALRGDKDAAAEFLQSAITGFEAADMPLHAAVSRRRLGELLGGQAGRTLIDQAHAWMTGQGIKNPPRMTALYAPGFRDECGPQ
jgi:tetratricopeptide (TPR) repeat protein